jgi:hypothetical protein
VTKTIDVKAAIANTPRLARELLARALTDAIEPADDEEKWSRIEAVILTLQGAHVPLLERRAFFLTAVGSMVKRRLAGPICRERLLLHDKAFVRLSAERIAEVVHAARPGKRSPVHAAAELAVEARALDLGKRGQETVEQAQERAVERLKEARKAASAQL